MSYEKELKELHLMQQIYATIFTLTNKIQVNGDKIFEELTVRQFMTMLAILHLPEGEASLNRIAEKTGTTKQNINSMVNTLEKKGFVKIEPSQFDKRAINVTITESGELAMVSGSKKSIFFMADLFVGFSSKELELLWSLLKKMRYFDGRQQDDFEDEASLRVIETPDIDQIQILETFKQLRNKKE